MGVRIRQAMKGDSELLKGIIEMDETFTSVFEDLRSVQMGN